MKLSVEFFPPKTEKGRSNLLTVANDLKAIGPEYYSVTFGAGGSTLDFTQETVKTLIDQSGVDTAPHISGLGQTKEQISTLLTYYQNIGVNRLVVLRGDVNGDAPTGDFKYGIDLVRYIRETTGNHFTIEVGAYPEFHPEATCAKDDIIHFVEKAQSGADAAITQYFFNADSYFRFVEKVRALGCDIPIIPGIMPITDFEKIARFSKMCGAEIPRWLTWRMQELVEDKEAMFDLGTDVVSDMVTQLVDGGAPAIHFYSMNQSKATLKICENLNWLK